MCIRDSFITDGGAAKVARDQRSDQQSWEQPSDIVQQGTDSDKAPVAGILRFVFSSVFTDKLYRQEPDRYSNAEYPERPGNQPSGYSQDPDRPGKVDPKIQLFDLKIANIRKHQSKNNSFCQNRGLQAPAASSGNPLPKLRFSGNS